MSVPTAFNEEIASSSLGDEQYPQSVQAKGSLWYVFKFYGRIAVKEYGSSYISFIRLGVDRFILTKALSSDGSVYSDRFWVWYIDSSGGLKLKEIEPVSDSDPITNFTKSIASNAINLASYVQYNDAIRLFVLFDENPTVLKALVYDDIDSDPTITQLSWSADRNDNLGSFITSEADELNLSYQKFASGPNVYSVDYSLVPPSSLSAYNDPIYSLDVDISWSASSDPDVDVYVLERDTSPSFLSASTVSYQVSADSYSDVVPDVGTYYYRVKGRSLGLYLDSTYSNTDQVPIAVSAFQASSHYEVYKPSHPIGVDVDYLSASFSALSPEIIFPGLIVSAGYASASYNPYNPGIGVVIPDPGTYIRFYISSYYDVKAGGIRNYDEADPMPNEWLRKCDGEDYDNERNLFRSLITEAYNRHGVCGVYFVTTYDKTYDRIFGEDGDRFWVRKFDTMAFFPLQTEEEMWTKLGIEGIDSFSIFISKDHFREASTYGQDLVAGNIGPDTYGSIVPKPGDVFQTEYNKYLYEVVSVKEEEMMAHLSKHYVWELIVSPLRDEHLRFSATTSASINDGSPISAFSQPDIFDISDDVSNEVSAYRYDPPAGEPDPRDPFGGW